MAWRAVAGGPTRLQICPTVPADLGRWQRHTVTVAAKRNMNTQKSLRRRRRWAGRRSGGRRGGTVESSWRRNGARWGRVGDGGHCGGGGGALAGDGGGGGGRIGAVGSSTGDLWWRHGRRRRAAAASRQTRAGGGIDGAPSSAAIQVRADLWMPAPRTAMDEEAKVAAGERWRWFHR